jgi:hypothetical protein
MEPLTRLAAWSPLFWFRLEPVALDRPPPERRLLGPGTTPLAIFVYIKINHGVSEGEVDLR